MTVRTTPIFIQGNSHPAEETRLMLAGILGSVTGSFAGGVASSDAAHGVVRATDLAVTQNGTPNMTVNVAAGGCFIRGTQSANQGAYHLYNDASLSVAISAADATNPRRDLIIAQARDLNYSGADKDGRIIVVTGTPAASPSDPSLSSYPNALVLARVAVAAGATSILTANITDLRPVANQLGKMPTFTTAALAATAIPSPIDGQGYYLNTNTTTEGPQYWNGSAYRLPWNLPWGYVSNGYLSSSVTATGLNWAAAFTWNGTGVVANRRYLMQAFFNLEPSNLGQINAEVGSGIGSGTEGRAAYYANGTSWISGLAVAGVFTTTAGSMTRYASFRMSSGTGGVTAQIGSTYQILDIGPAGAPS